MTLSANAETLASPDTALDSPGLASGVPFQERALIPEQDEWAHLVPPES